MDTKEPSLKRRKSESTLPVVVLDLPFKAEFQCNLHSSVQCVSWEEVFGYGPDTDRKTAESTLIQETDEEKKKRKVLRSKVVGVITNLHPAVTGAHMDVLPELRVISNNGVGYEHIDTKAANDRNIPVSNTPGCLQATTADLAWALLLAAARNIVSGDHISRTQSTFDPNWWGREVSGATLGIVGLGGIGREVAKRAVGFSMNVLYHGRKQKSEEEETVLGTRATYTSLEQLLKQSDYVVLCCPGTPETNKMIGSSTLQLMKKDAILVNVGRGCLVDQEALLLAVQSGTIGGAALDVTDPEPLPKGHPLLSCPGVIITPHIGSATSVARKRMFDLALDNLLRGVRGEALLTPVQP